MELIIGLVAIYLIYKILFGGKKTDAEAANNNSRSSNMSKSTPRNQSQNKIRVSVSTIDDSNKDDFSTFEIHTSFGNEPTRSKNTSEGRWLGEKEVLVINGRNITKGFFYFGGVLNGLNGYGLEPSLVDKDRPASEVNDCDFEYQDDSLGYWPSYATLSKECRGLYLDWLASDRTNEDISIGYVFIYFYGFERRIIEDISETKVSDVEFLAIFNEITRLLGIYGVNRSFRSYSSGLLELMYFLRKNVIDDAGVKAPESNNSLAFKFRLAKNVQSGVALQSELALEWLKDTGEYSLKAPARRCEDEFAKLFKLKFDNKFPEGFSVKPNKTKLKLTFRAASNAIPVSEIDAGDLPDPSILKGPIKKLIPIADECTEQLNAYSRYLAKSNTSRHDVAALLLLPNELVTEIRSPVIERFKSWSMAVINENNGLTSVKEFWKHLDMPLPKATNKKENELIISLASKVDVGVAPDFRFHQSNVKLDGNLVLFTPGHGKFFEPSRSYYQVATALRLGAIVATIDGRVDDSEMQVLKRLIDSDDSLSPGEKTSLHAYLKWRLNSPVNMVGLKARVESLKDDEIEFVKKIIVSIALADGSVEVSEVRQLEKLYTAIGLDKSQVSSDIHKLTSNDVHKAQNGTSTNTDLNSFSIDKAVLAMHENDTKSAKSMLESIFIEEEPKIEVEFQGHNDGLDDAHKAVYNILVTKEQWSRNEAQSIFSEHKLMIDGAIETINDWSFDMVDAPVLEQDDDIFIDLEIVDELKG
ncbi:TerB N-terminal domain-containing protein [Vibrio splendidus]|uniref:tellurite resistance TerB family protein n=1 Tax=Vibrio splendidus TaxID=29497 RepID=UPI000C83515F|nr:TerB N-terminal domain-containing protein [Vibrio splendidus]PMM09291.1 ATPase [Vibrio splendidus]PMN25817.1 ATPase [Vibrio splendidus]